MKCLQKLWVWYYLLNKRFFKKYSFIVLLLLIPLLVKGMELVAEQKSGMLKIVLCQEDPEDKSASAMIADLMKENELLYYTRAESVEEAEEAVRKGNADAAWIFAEDTAGRMEAYAKGTLKEKAIITVIEREDNVAIQLSREKLYGTIYPRLSYAIYQNYLKNLSGMKHLEEQRQKEAYEATAVEGSIFKFAYADEKMGTEDADMHYLLMPMRGLLCLVIMLCGLAAAMYLMQDEQGGKFVWVGAKWKTCFSLLYYVPVVVNAALAVGLALVWSGLFLDGKRELLCVLLYLIMTIGFCELLRKWTGRLQILGAGIPLLILGMLVLCPIFIEFRNFRSLQYLLPPFYYLTALYNDTFIGKSLVYIVGLYSLIFITDYVKKKLL